jgi:hypothetical protein
MVANASELAMQRKITENFINCDKTSVVLSPKSETWNAGTVSRLPGTNRQAQDFKVIWYPSDGITFTIDGETRRFDFILVGKYDAQVEIGDTWKIDGQENEITYVFPSNFYEVKCGGLSHGSKPAA